MSRSALLSFTVLLFQFKNFCSAQRNELVKEDQEFVDSLLKYEIVYPRLRKNARENTNVPGRTDGNYEKQGEKLLSLYLGKEEVTLELFLNSGLFSVNYFERSVTKDGMIISDKNSHHCFYHGSVLGTEETFIAAISTCDGISGYFTFFNKTYLIQPVKSVIGEVFHLLFQAEDVERPRYKCSHTRSQPLEILPVINIPKSHRSRRDVFSETKYLEMVIVNDKSQFQKYGDKTAMRTKEIANIVDSVYRVYKIRIILIMIEIWKIKDKITVQADAKKTLDNFETYKRDILDQNPSTKNDNAQLLTQLSFTGDAVGKAAKLSICSKTSTGIVKDHSSDTFLTGSTMAHELGHNFGLDHDEDFPDKNCNCGNPKGCLMSSHLGSTPLLKLSTCSITSLKNTLLANYGTCLFDLPTKHARDQECGNAFLEEGETCDCGPKEHCELIGNNCCNYTTCHLYPESECSDGPCCENCKFKPRGIICRDKVNKCDLPEYCDGKNQLCAPDSYVHNGRPCKSADGSGSLCFLGVCHTHTSQCKTLWGTGSSNAHKTCYDRLNTLTASYGHCKKLSNNKYLACQRKDVLCGKLHCKNVPKSGLPIIGTHRKGQPVDVGKIKCWTADVYLGDDIPEPGLVQDGTKCGDNKVCYNNTCINVDEVYNQPNCPLNCSNNGICNNHGHCHCNHGYKPPDCKETCLGIGGSIDSGIGYGCFDPNATVTPTTITTNYLPSKNTSTVTHPSERITINPTTKDPNAPSSVSFTTNIVPTTNNVSTVSTVILPSKHITIKPTTKVTNEPTEGTITDPTVTTTTQAKEETTHTDNEVTGKQDRSVENSTSPSVIAVAIIIPLVLLILVIFIIYHFREKIRTKFARTRQPPQKPFTTVSYADEKRRGSTSSQEILTDAAARPTRLNIGGPVRNEITVTPDRSPGFASTPSGKFETKGPVPRREPPVRPGAPLPPLGPRISSLPDLLDSKQPVKRPAPPNKSKSFNVADKPTRPKPPAVRQSSNVEKDNKPDVKVPKRPPLKPGEKPGTVSDPFNRSALRKTGGIDDSESLQKPASVDPAFRPSDVKAGKSPSWAKKL